MSDQNEGSAKELELPVTVTLDEAKNDSSIGMNTDLNVDVEMKMDMNFSNGNEDENTIHSSLTEASVGQAQALHLLPPPAAWYAATASTTANLAVSRTKSEIEAGAESESESEKSNSPVPIATDAMDEPDVVQRDGEIIDKSVSHHKFKMVKDHEDAHEHEVAHENSSKLAISIDRKVIDDYYVGGTSMSTNANTETITNANANTNTNTDDDDNDTCEEHGHQQHQTYESTSQKSTIKMNPDTCKKSKTKATTIPICKNHSITTTTNSNANASKEISPSKLISIYTKEQYPALTSPTISKSAIASAASKIKNKSKKNKIITTSQKEQLKQAAQKQIRKNILAIKRMTIDTIPNAAQELITASAHKAYHYTRLSYSTSKLFGKFQLHHSEVGNQLGGYDREAITNHGIRDTRTDELLWMETNNTRKGHENEERVGKKKKGQIHHQQGNGYAWEDEWDKARISLPPFSSLPWVDRQLVKEWRTCDYLTYDYKRNKVNVQVDVGDAIGEDEDDCDLEQRQKTDDTDTDLHDDDFNFDQARTRLPQPITKPPWENASSCYACRKAFGSAGLVNLRHHCRLCGRSYCQMHSRWSHRLPHLGYSPDVPERVCAPCKQVLESQNLAERIAWRIARCRDYLAGSGDDDGNREPSLGLCPYFETGVDTVEDAAARLTKAAIHMAKSIPLGATAHVTVETLDVLRKHGLKGVYGLILRKEFMAAADLLCRVTGINKKVWPLSVHELSAAIFYALAQHRALRGVDPEREHRIHAFKESDIDDGDDNSDGSKTVANKVVQVEECHIAQIENCPDENQQDHQNVLLDETDMYDPKYENTNADLDTKENGSIPEKGSNQEIKRQVPNIPAFESKKEEETSKSKRRYSQNDSSQQDLPFTPVCEPVTDGLLSSLIFYAPLALDFIYATTEVDMQLLAAQQGWRLVYTHLNQDVKIADKPASALFVHSKQKIACFAVRGTATINDVVIDIRAMPVQFPDSDMDGLHEDEEGWTPVMKGQGLALCGMAGAACNLFRENIDALLLLARQGYRIRLTGHSLGGGVAALLGALIKRHFEFHLPTAISSQMDILRVYSYGSPACVDAKLADYAQSYVTNCVMHDDCIPRLTPTSIRALLKHLLYIRETWVKTHLTDDLMAITERAKTAWAPKLRNGFTLMYTGNPSIKVYTKLKAKGKSLKKKIKKGKKKLKTMASNRSSNNGSDRDSINFVSNQIEDTPLRVATDIGSDSEDEDTNIEEDGGGMLFDGDCFYEAEESLIEHSDDEDSMDSNSPGNKRDPSLDEWVPFDEPLPDELCDLNGSTTADNSPQSESANAVMLEETPLPRMFIPGKIVHMYTHRGAYKAAIVPRAFRELRRISLAGSMLNDHMSKSYYEGLLECKSVRQAEKDLPEWTGFGEEKTCSCCASRFTWASTSDSEAQEARDRHNCRACGGLVCEPCSKNRVPIPNIGIHVTSRVCDRCYYDMGGVLSATKSMTRSFVGGKHSEMSRSGIEHGDYFVEDLQHDSKRNPIVDELAMRMPSAAIS